MTGSRYRFVPLMVAVACAAALLGACGSGDKNVASKGPDTTVVAGGPDTTSSGPKAAARWESVTTLSGGTEPVSPTFDILAGAIQWRARFDCSSGTLKVETTPPPRRPGAIIDTACPKTGEGYSILTGPVKLTVTATGPWKIVVDQQIDTPLNEAPLPAMATAKVVSQGSFYNVEKNGEGSARVYQLADGSRALRIENLMVNQNTDLFVWLDEAKSPKTSKDVASAQYWVLGNLKSTVGSQNYVIPSNIPIDRVNSIVIWCEPVAIAYAAASLAP
jgi:hypothetical protein